ncbi:MAG TPA: adenylate kinase [Thermomicrobiales bacterium]|nr:adenylate kinase [Thermomicrobiales bacterium]
MNIILMGAQGSGKGTQAAIIAPKLSLEKVATGDLFRAAIADGTELGVQVKSILERGDLVPDELTNAIVWERLESIAALKAAGELNGALFDGYPRTAGQAEALDEILARQHDRIDAVIEIQVPRETLIKRLSGRRVCPVCGAVYHIEAEPPRIQGQCDNDGATLVQRQDDTPEAIRHRLEIYDKQTAPLLAYYDAKDVLSRVDGDQAIDEVTQAILAAIPVKEA